MGFYATEWQVWIGHTHPTEDVPQATDGMTSIGRVKQALVQCEEDELPAKTEDILGRVTSDVACLLSHEAVGLLRGGVDRETMLAHMMEEVKKYTKWHDKEVMSLPECVYCLACGARVTCD